MRHIESDQLKLAHERFVEGMESRLVEKEEIGYTGWDGEYPIKKLIKEIEDDFRLVKKNRAPEKGLFDIANRVMMLWYRKKFSDSLRGRK